MLQLPKEIQSDIAAGRLTPKAAREILKVQDNSKRKAVAVAAVAKALSAEETKQLVKSTTGANLGTKPKQKSLAFDTEFGEVVITFEVGVTYDHLEEALKQAMDEVQLRIRNRVTP